MDGVGPTDKTTTRPRIELDVAKYEAYLDDPSLSDEDKAQILEALWSIIVAFVDLGFNVHPAQAAQRAKNVCGKGEKDRPSPATECEDSLYSRTIAKHFEDKAADGFDPPADKEESDDRSKR